jgi:excisionase family DNA binding protein
MGQEVPKEPYLTAEEAARLVGFAAGTIRRWAREGRIRSNVVDGRRRFLREDLEAISRRCPDHC